MGAKTLVWDECAELGVGPGLKRSWVVPGVWSLRGGAETVQGECDESEGKGAKTELEDVPSSESDRKELLHRRSGA